MAACFRIFPGQKVHTHASGSVRMRRTGSLREEAIDKRRALAYSPPLPLSSSSSSAAGSSFSFSSLSSSLEGGEAPGFRFFFGCVRCPSEDVADEEADSDGSDSDSDSDESVSCSPKTPLSSSSRPSLSSISLRLRRLSTRLNIMWLEGERFCEPRDRVTGVIWRFGAARVCARFSIQSTGCIAHAEDVLRPPSSPSHTHHPPYQDVSGHGCRLKKWPGSRRGTF